MADSKDFSQGAVYAMLDVPFAHSHCSARWMPTGYFLPVARKFEVAHAILCLFFGNVEMRKAALVFITPFLYAFEPFLRQKSVFPGFLINFGKWAFRMLLTEPPRPFGGPVFEIQGFLAAFSLRTEKVIARCKEHINFVTSLRF